MVRDGGHGNRTAFPVGTAQRVEQARRGLGQVAGFGQGKGTGLAEGDMRLVPARIDGVKAQRRVRRVMAGQLARGVGRGGIGLVEGQRAAQPSAWMFQRSPTSTAKA